MKPSRKQFLFKNGSDHNALKLAFVSRGASGFAFGGLQSWVFVCLPKVRALTPVRRSVPVARAAGVGSDSLHPQPHAGSRRPSLWPS